MYSTPQHTLPVVQEEEMGINAPVHHQRIIAQLTAGLYPLFKSGKIPYEAFPEMMVGEESSPVPDVVVYDNETEQVRIVIEVCQNRGMRHDLNKMIRLIDEDEYGIEEGFVYNYKTKQWFRYRKGQGGMAQVSSYSELLHLDLNQFL
nr:Uma2 family endonuclease [uncultured Arsenicibacter sp.]